MNINHHLDLIDINKYSDLEISEVVAKFKVHKTGRPLDLYVNISYHGENQYMGIANYYYQGPKQATPYRSITFRNSIKGAFDDAIRGIEAFYKDYYDSSTVIRKREDGKKFNGDGDEIIE